MPRDFSKPFSAAEQEEIKAIFRRMPSYTDADGGSIDLADSVQFAKEIEFERTPEEMATVAQYWEKTTGGHIVTFQSFMGALTSIHDRVEMAKFFARSADKDGNGFISSEEFEDLLTALRVSNKITLDSISFEDFVKAADTNKDGKISIEECADWIREFTK